MEATPQTDTNQQHAKTLAAVQDGTAKKQVAAFCDQMLATNDVRTIAAHKNMLLPYLQHLGETLYSMDTADIQKTGEALPRFLDVFDTAAAKMMKAKRGKMSEENADCIRHVMNWLFGSGFLSAEHFDIWYDTLEERLP